MREALTVIGFLLILALAALFAAPLYVDWNSWRGQVAQRLSQHLGVEVRINGSMEARLLPQPWLSLHGVTIGNPEGGTRLSVEGIDGDVSLPGLLRGDVELSNVVIYGPRLTLASDENGRIVPLSGAGMSADAAIENFEIQNGTVQFVDARTATDVLVEDLHLVGETASFSGPIKAEGGLKVGGVLHTVKLSTGAIAGGAMKLRVSAVPADRPVTMELDGDMRLDDGKAQVVGSGTLARLPVNTHGDKAPPEAPWTITSQMKMTVAGIEAPSVAIQIGPEERPLKLTGKAAATFGKNGLIQADLTATQLELDRFVGVTPDRRLAPLLVLDKVHDDLPGFSDLSSPVRLSLAVQGVMAGGQMMQDVKADLAARDGRWSISSLQANLPGKTRLVMAGDMAAVEGKEHFDGKLSLVSRQASTLIAWLQAMDHTAAPNAARNITLDAAVAAGPEVLSLSKLKLAIDEATVEGEVSWKRLPTAALSGRIEADLSAQRLDLDALPSVAALLPGAGALFSEADVKLAAQSVVFAGVEAKSANGRVKAGGKVVALEDVTIDDLGGTSLSANGRIDNVGASPQGEIRITVDGRDLTGLAQALKRSALPPALLEAFSRRAASLSPAGANVLVSIGDTKRITLDGKLGGTVTQFAVEISGPDDKPVLDAHLRADSLDAAVLLRQFGLSPAAVKIPGRSTLTADISGPLNGPRRWSAGFEGGGFNLSGSGKVTGAFDTPALDGRLTLRSSDILTPAQLFGVAMPGVLPAEAVEIETGFRARGGRFAFDDLSGTLLGMPLTGAMTVDPGTPLRIDGRLSFTSADALRLGSLVSGADLEGVAAPNTVWSSDRFGASSLDGLAGSLVLSADMLKLSETLPAAHDAKAVLSFEPAIANLDGFSANLAQGTVSGALHLTRPATGAALTGRLTLAGIKLEAPGLTGQLDAGLDLQGTGKTPAQMIGALTGGGTLVLRQPVFGGLAERAFATVTKAVDAGLAPQAALIKPLFEQNLAAAPFKADDLNGNLTLAGGTIRLGATTARGTMTGLTFSGQIDLAALSGKADIALTPAAPGDGFGGTPPTIGVTVAGPLTEMKRDVDITGLTAWLSIRASEQEAKKLEALEAERLAREKQQEEERRAEAERIRQLIEAQKAKDALTAKPGDTTAPKPPTAATPPLVVTPPPAPQPPADVQPKANPAPTIPTPPLAVPNFLQPGALGGTVPVAPEFLPPSEQTKPKPVPLPPEPTPR